jgi:ATP-binding cassette, subfamily C (CFTR/MRP), member 1
MPMFHLGYWAFLGSVFAIYLLSVEVGLWSSLAGTGTIVCYVAVQIQFAQQFGLRRRITAKITDMRVRLTSEMLSGISSVKAYAWERAFLDKLTGLRLMEHNSIFVSQSMKACTGALYFATPAIASLATFTTYTYGTNHHLNVDRVFNTIALINMMRLFIGAHLGRLLEFGPECYVATQRMQNFLMLPDVKPRRFRTKMNTYSSQSLLSSLSSDSPSSSPMNSPRSEVPPPSPSSVTHEARRISSVSQQVVGRVKMQRPPPPIVVEVIDASFGRDGTVTIENINLNIAKGELVLVAGPVGW